MLGKQLTTLATDSTIGGYCKIMSHELIAFIYPSHFTSLSVFKKAPVSDIAGVELAEVDDSAAAACSEFKYCSKSVMSGSGGSLRISHCLKLVFALPSSSSFAAFCILRWIN